MSCGCNNTVQYAPTACNPNFPSTCTALGIGVIQRVVGEDSAYCKYTVPTLNSNSILFYNASTALVKWGDGTSSNPVFLGNGSGQATGSSSCQLQATSPTGQLVAFIPPTSTETQFPVVSPSGTATNWGTIESIIPNQGVVCKAGSTPPSGVSANTVYEISGSSSDLVSFDTNGNPVASPISSIVGNIVPPAVVLPFAYNVTSGTVPSGWLLCDGTVYDKTSYPALSALIGNTYGGSTGTFAVPNMAGLFIRGLGTQTVSGNVHGSNSLGSIQGDVFKLHNHQLTDNGHTHTIPVGNYSAQTSGGNGIAIADNIALTGSSTTGITIAATGDTNETRPVNLAMVYCIKT
jgi:microcystin-dependent protein